LLLTLGRASAELPAGTPLLSSDLKSLGYFGKADAASTVHEVPVAGQAFTRALRVDTYSAAQPGNSGFQAHISMPIKKGDILWISFRSRCLKSTKESGGAFFQLHFDRLVEGKYKWPPHLERGVSFGREWTETSIPFEMDSNVTPDQVQLTIQFDSYRQSFEIGPITFIDYGPDVKLSDLPRSVVKYEGGEPDAPWRAAAEQRIEKIRKGDLVLKVTDAAGAPLVGAKVSLHMKRIAFDFGTAISSRILLDRTSPDSRKYREILAKYFNQAVFENEMKWPAWAKPNFSPAPTLEALDWLDQHDLTARGHCMVWPNWNHLPAFMADLKGDKDALRKAVLDHIDQQTHAMKGRFVQWDVTNELYANHALLDILGRDEMVDWYRAAHAGDPNVRLYYNEYTMFLSYWQHCYEDLKYLKEKGAPIGGLGEQAHIGGTPPPIPLVLSRLDKFAELGLPITITEFDITSNDEDFQARYLRDFMTAVFSHPAVVGFVQWGFWEGDHWVADAALWRKDWTLRKHGEAFTHLVGKVWRTDADGATDAGGNFKTRAFYGSYQVSITVDGKEQSFVVKHAPQGEPQPIVFAALPGK
jgi:GH35 family endo-1,4-beta-xylanase